MKSLTKYILESLDDTIDVDNMSIKIRTWFNRNKTGLLDFNSFVTSCKEEHKVDTDKLNEFISSFNKEKEFVDFINDDIEGTQTTDYTDAFMNIVRMLAGV